MEIYLCTRADRATEGFLADKSTQLILDALNLAVLEPDGALLHGAKSASALFPATAAAKQVAARCKEEGLVQVVRTETRGKTLQEFCTITEKGTAFLFEQGNPKDLLKDFVRALEVRHAQLDDVVNQSRRAQASLESLKSLAGDVLSRLECQFRPPGMPQPSTNGNGQLNWSRVLCDRLAEWKQSGVSEDCPLSELFHHVHCQAPDVSVGRFHDELRRLHDCEKVYLHPWTGPLYELPDPRLALLIGHEIVWYASLRRPLTA